MDNINGEKIMYLEISQKKLARFRIPRKVISYLRNMRAMWAARLLGGFKKDEWQNNM